MLPERAFGRSLTSIMFFRLFYADPDRGSMVALATMVDRRARSADRRTQLVGYRLDIFGEVLPALHGPPTGDDNLRRGELRALRFRQFLAHEARNAGIGGGRRLLDRRSTARARCLEG